MNDERILPLSDDELLYRGEEKYPEDNRPRQAIEAARDWEHSGVFKMADVRKTALAAHLGALKYATSSFQYTYDNDCQTMKQ